jgi:hypothetical protein
MGWFVGGLEATEANAKARRLYRRLIDFWEERARQSGAPCAARTRGRVSLSPGLRAALGFPNGPPDAAGVGSALIGRPKKQITLQLTARLFTATKRSF